MKQKSQGYADSLMLDHEGNVAEATGANIFFKDKKWRIFTRQYQIVFWME